MMVGSSLHQNVCTYTPNYTVSHINIDRNLPSPLYSNLRPQTRTQVTLCWHVTWCHCIFNYCHTPPSPHTVPYNLHISIYVFSPSLSLSLPTICVPLGVILWRIWSGAGRDGGLAAAPPVAVSEPAGVTPGSCAPSGPNIIIISQCHSGCPACWMRRHATQR